MITDIIIIDSMTTDGMTIDDIKDSDNFNIILKVETMRSHRMFGRHVMTHAKLVNHHQYLIASFVDKMDIMKISARQKTKGKLQR